MFETVILDDNAVAEIAALPVHEGDTTEFRRLNSVGMPAVQRDALCQTARALRAELSTTKGYWADTAEDLASALLKQEELEEQLAAVTQERDTMQERVAHFSNLADERHDLLSAERRANDDLRAERAKMLQSLERAQQERNVAVRYLAKHDFERCAEADHGCDGWHPKL